MKWNRAKVCYLLSAVLTGIFVAKNPLDYLVYTNTLNSAPFWVSILVNAVCFLIPAAIALICGIIIAKRK